MIFKLNKDKGIQWYQVNSKTIGVRNPKEYLDTDKNPTDIKETKILEKFLYG